MTLSRTFVRAVAACAVCAAVLGLAACQAAPEPPAAEAGDPIDARLVRVETVQWPTSYEAGGVVRARQTAVLSSRVLAPVTEVRVSAGDRVSRGQTLVVLDSRELDAQQTRAAASASAAGLGHDAARAELDAARSALVLARATFDRIQSLAERKSATAQELDQATAGLAAAEARVAGATARVSEAEQGMAAARAGAQAAEVGASYARITAPFDGIVSARHADPGTLAAPGAPLLTLDDTSRFRLEARVDESHAQGVTVGADAQVRLDDTAADAWQSATVSEVSSVDPERHSFLVKLDLPPGLSLRSGQFGRVRLLGTAREVLSAPRAAIVRRGQLSYAFVLDGEGRARLRMASVGETSGDRVEILAGLMAGDRVVADPPPGLEDGRPVRGASADAAGARP
ncbi:MAG: efflux RND transporter periplasmic adaptor subunit [Vicinamibacterales bacterium]